MFDDAQPCVWSWHRVDRVTNSWVYIACYIMGVTFQHLLLKTADLDLQLDLHLPVSPTISYSRLLISCAWWNHGRSWSLIEVMFNHAYYKRHRLTVVQLENASCFLTQKSTLRTLVFLTLAPINSTRSILHALVGLRCLWCDLRYFTIPFVGNIT